MKQLFYARHGESTANAKHVYAGNSPHIELTALGRQQAASAGEDLADRNIDVIVASPLDRAQETAKIIAGQIGYSENLIVTDLRLHEIDVGTLTGQPDNGFDECFDHMSNGLDPSAETPEDVAERITSFILDAASQYEDKVVLVVAHAGIGRVFRAILTGVTLQSLGHTSLPNAVPFELPLDRIDDITKTAEEVA